MACDKTLRRDYLEQLFADLSGVHAISYPVGAFVDVNIVFSILINRVRKKRRKGEEFRRAVGSSWRLVMIPVVIAVTVPASVTPVAVAVSIIPVVVSVSVVPVTVPVIPVAVTVSVIPVTITVASAAVVIV